MSSMRDGAPLPPPRVAGPSHGGPPGAAGPVVPTAPPSTPPGRSPSATGPVTPPASVERDELVRASVAARDRSRAVGRRWRIAERVVGFAASGIVLAAVAVATRDGFGRPDATLMFWIPVGVGLVAVHVGVRALVAHAGRSSVLAARRGAADAAARVHAHDTMHRPPR